jgi:hypothetical protein
MAEIAEYSDFIKYVMADLPGCADAVLVQYLQQAGRKLCEESECWKEEIDVNVVADQTEYSLDTIDDTYIHKIAWVKIKSVSTDDFEDCPAINPNYYTLKEDTTLKFYTANAPIVTITSGMRVKAIIRPEFNSNELPQWIWDRYSEAIQNHCKWQLMKQPKKPWTDLQLSMKYEKEYYNCIAQAKMDINKQFKSVNLRASGGRFF